MRPINWDASHPHPDVQLPLPVLSTCPVCLGSSHSQVLWGICNEDRELAPGRPGPSLWVEHPSQKWKLGVGESLTGSSAQAAWWSDCCKPPAPQPSSPSFPSSELGACGGSHSHSTEISRVCCWEPCLFSAWQV